MFILRRVSSDGIQMNHVIGNDYTFVGRFENPKEFRRTFENNFDKKHYADLDPKSDDSMKRIYAYLCYDGKEQPLYAGQNNYIMTETGKTFSNVSYK